MGTPMFLKTNYSVTGGSITFSKEQDYYFAKIPSLISFGKAKKVTFTPGIGYIHQIECESGGALGSSSYEEADHTAWSSYIKINFIRRPWKSLRYTPD